ncbi:DsbA family protein [Colwellia sp. UCD-KL20]|uniref:DsbA family protein n=1 Tax=Colwellia sp. UCD-KL20 TaxID=1917165 RepID=UPI0025702D38|nr:DsbA family protein [Colwellia sp. UCD-KL20]
MDKTLIYVHDPMCSWCWGFEPVRKKLFNSLTPAIIIKRFVGGLAPDSNEPMPQQMQTMLQNTWRKIEQTIPGTEFNYDFWSHCQPRRSTYPSNRAVIAARQQSSEYDELITHRIQQAYYTEAKNPSDKNILIELAKEIGLNVEQFTQDIQSEKIDKLFQQELLYARKLGMNSFPSLAYQVGDKIYSIGLDYNSMEKMLEQIHQIDTLR